MPEKINCVLVTNGLSISWKGELTPCCEWYPDFDLSRQKSLTYHWNDYQGFNNNVRQLIFDEFEQGIRHAGCKKCFDDEDKGYPSLRTTSNALHANASTEVNIDNPIYNFELKLSNLCNLKCIMCGPYASTTWYAELKQYQHKLQSLRDQNNRNIFLELDPPSDWADSEEFQTWLVSMLGHTESINITGGEPLTMPSTQWILQTLLNNGLKGTRLQMVSNFSKVPPAVRQLLKQFTDVNLVASLEGVGAMNDYVRFPSDWSDTENNIKMLIDDLGRRSLNVIHVFQHTSVYSLPALIDWCIEHKLELKLNSVGGRSFMSTASCLEQDFADFVAWIENHPRLPRYEWGRRVQTFVEAVAATYQFDAASFRAFRVYVQTLDDIRGTNFDKVFRWNRTLPAY